MNCRQISTFILLLLALPILVSCEEQTVTPVPPTVFIQDSDNKGLKALALRDSVTLVRGISSQKLVLLETTELALDDQLTVIDAGRALLAISDSLIVELIREGNLTVQELTVDEETVLLALAMKSGAVLNDLNIEDAIDGLLKIEGEYATITATGTTFLVVKEENTPLEWVVALDSTPSDLTVTADNVSTEIVTGKAVWVAPFGPPGPMIDANINAVNDWIDGLRNGSDMSELGETVWDYAEMEIAAAELPDPVPVDTPIDIQQVTLTLDPAGSYERVDCNGDGDLDLWSANGRINFDLRQIIGQKRAIDVEIVNGNPTLETTLTGYNPANEIVPDTGVAATSGSVGTAEALNLRSEVQPFHFAELLLGDGCFIGMKLVPPDEPILEATLTPTPTITPSPTTTPTPSATPGCTPSPPAGWVLYTVVPFDTMFNLSNRTGAPIPIIQQTNCWFSNNIIVGQRLWLPFIPPTITPTSTPTLTPTTHYMECKSLDIVVYDYDYDTSVESVEPTNQVTFAVYGLPADENLQVMIGRPGDSPGNFISVATINTGAGEYNQYTVYIPGTFQRDRILELSLHLQRSASCYSGSVTFTQSIPSS